MSGLAGRGGASLRRAERVGSERRPIHTTVLHSMGCSLGYFRNRPPSIHLLPRMKKLSPSGRSYCPGEEALAEKNHPFMDLASLNDIDGVGNLG